MPWTQSIRCLQTQESYREIWKAVAEQVPGRTDKQLNIVNSWLTVNHLIPFIKNGGWSPEEDDEILSFHRIQGSRWSKLAKLMPTRTDNVIQSRIDFTSCHKKLNSNLENFYRKANRDNQSAYAFGEFR